MKTNFKSFLKIVTTLLVVFSMVFVCTGSSYATSTWNKGEKVNYVPSSGDTLYKSSDWIKNLDAIYQLKWYEDPTRDVLKGEFMLVQLRTIQASLARRGLPLLSERYMTLDFKDNDTLTQSAKSEAQVLKSLGILSGTLDGYMKVNAPIKRSEAAKIVDVTNSKVLHIPFIRSPKIFQDTKGHWAENSISTVYQITLINGTSESTFSPDDSLTIEQTLQILENEVGYSGIIRADVAKAMKETFKVTMDASLVTKNSYEKFEEKMHIYGFNKIYDNGSTKINEKVTKLEALKMVISSIYNYADFNSFYFYPESAKDEDFLEIMKNIGMVEDIGDYNGCVKYIDVLEYFANAKKIYLKKDITNVDNIEVENISKYSQEKQNIIKDMVANKIMEAPNNQLPLDDDVTKGMLNEIVINFVEKYSTITPNGEKLNEDPNNIPSNYKEYPYILASVDKEVYEIKNRNVDDRDYVNAADLYKHEKEHYLFIEEIVNKYLNTILNVDYTNLDEEKFKENVRSISLYHVSDRVFNEYFEYVKSNKIQISGTCKVQFPAIYSDGFTYRVRTKLELNVKNTEQSLNLLFGDIDLMGDVKYDGNNFSRIIEVPLSKYYNNLQFGVFVSSLTTIPYTGEKNVIVEFPNSEAII